MDLADRVVLTEWRPDWASDASILAEKLGDALGSTALRIDHIGSTSVPGLAAKDVIDVQVIVARLDRRPIIDALVAAQFAQRYAELNLRDHIPAGWVGDTAEWNKLVFATPPDVRLGNVHVRVSGSANERYALLFRDFLTADLAAREAWGRFKKGAGRRHSDARRLWIG
jgi:GrpB-like predicted nucleotidyltransferase (UPF0157 family)